MIIIITKDPLHCWDDLDEIGMSYGGMILWGNFLNLCNPSQFVTQTELTVQGCTVGFKSVGDFVTIGVHRIVSKMCKIL